MKHFNRLVFSVSALVLSISVGIFTPSPAWACACGCGIFEVGTNNMFPTHEGGMAYLEYDYLHQNRNWSGDSPSPADHNDDKKLISNFFTLGYQYLFNRSWGVMGEVPYTNRYFKTLDDETGNVSGFTHSAIGDVRLKGIYTGFSPDLSSGLTFGLRLPTGSYKYPNFDPDVEIGSGSTDLLLGGYHMAPITADQHWDWFANAELDQPILHYSGYVPGSEINASAGVYYNHAWFHSVKVAPLVEVLGSQRWSDSGRQADAPNSGYERALIAPGIELDTHRFSVYTDVGFPLYQHTTGNQIVAAEYFKFNIGYHF